MKGSDGFAKSLDEKTADLADMETYERSREGSLQNPELSSGHSVEYFSESLLKPSIFSLKTPDPSDLSVFHEPLQTSPSQFEESSNQESEPSKLEAILNDLSLNEEQSEPLLINEDIDFLLTVSSPSSSMSLSLTYSNTVSTIFPTFLSQNILLKSLPVSPDGTAGFNARSFETADPRFFIDRIDLGVDEMEEEDDQQDSFHQVCEKDLGAEDDLPPGNLLADPEPTTFQAKDTKCTCDRCSIF